jgi:hypothetical protein
MRAPVSETSSIEGETGKVGIEIRLALQRCGKAVERQVDFVRSLRRHPFARLSQHGIHPIAESNFFQQKSIQALAPTASLAPGERAIDFDYLHGDA